MSSVHVPFGMRRERGGGRDDDAAVWRGRTEKSCQARRSSSGAEKAAPRRERERGRTGDACTALLGVLARDDVLPGSLSAGSRVSGSDELRVPSGARCTYVYVSI